MSLWSVTVMCFIRGQSHEIGGRNMQPTSPGRERAGCGHHGKFMRNMWRNEYVANSCAYGNVAFPYRYVKLFMEFSDPHRRKSQLLFLSMKSTVTCHLCHPDWRLFLLCNLHVSPTCRHHNCVDFCPHVRNASPW